MHEQSTPSRWKRLAVASTFVVAAVVGSLAAAVPAGAAAPHPAFAASIGHSAVVVPNDAGPRCGTGSSSGNVNTCITAFGTGLFVDHIVVKATIVFDGRKLQVCLRGPQGVLGCGPPVGFADLQKPGDFVRGTWSPQANEPAGDYCANTWRSNGDGTKTQIGHECINVHA